MKLNQLVFLRNSLQSAFNLSGIKDELEKNRQSLVSAANSSEYENEYFKSKVIEVADAHANLFSVFIEEKNKINILIEELNEKIHTETQRFFSDNYQTECYVDSINSIRNIKKMFLADGSEEFIKSRIYTHSSSKYPALEIASRNGYWTRYLVGSDPLYIADGHDEFFNELAERFTPEYNARLRKYYIKDFRIEGLPKNQFGFILSYNYFNYLSLDTIKQYLHQAMEWLRPGGILMFTYNNADLSASAGLCENYYMTYVPKSMLIPMAESLGFEIFYSADYLPSTSWIELKKPGTLNSVKVQQALGEIKYY